MNLKSVKEGMIFFARKVRNALESQVVVSLRQEVEILRNEVQENIAAIHRLEILTLDRKTSLLQDFGKQFKSTLPCKTDDSFKPRGYSFGIITNGKRTEKMHRLIESIDAQGLPDDSHEILVAGCVSEFEGLPHIKAFPMAEAALKGRLGAMRNVLSTAASFNKFLSLDDDFILHPDWAKAVEAVDDNFDVATGVIVNPDLTRYCDWVDLTGDHTHLRPYHEGFGKSQYVTGGCGVYKDYVLSRHSWDDRLGFYEGEDVAFSRGIFEAGYQLKFMPQAIVMHDDEHYRQKGYGVIRARCEEDNSEKPELRLRLDKLCPRTV